MTWSLTSFLALLPLSLKLRLNQPASVSSRTTNTFSHLRVFSTPLPLTWNIFYISQLPPSIFKCQKSIRYFDTEVSVHKSCLTIVFLSLLMVNSGCNYTVFVIVLLIVSPLPGTGSLRTGASCCCFLLHSSV